MKNMVYIQSGGPTSVINTSFYGAIRETQKHSDEIDHIYGSQHGIEGLIFDDLIDIGTNGLGSRLDGLDAVMREDGLDKALLHCLGMARIGAELHSPLLVVPHVLAPMRYSATPMP